MKVKDLISGLEYLNLPTKIGIVLVGLFIVMQVIGEITEFTGKTVPEILKIRKFFTRRKREKEEATQTLKEVKQLLDHVDGHYSADNIAKRDEWMNWVNNRADTYDTFIKEMGKQFKDVTEALNNNTKMTEDMFVQNSRDRIIDFAEKVSDPNYIASLEQFHRIFNIHDEYENFLKSHNRTNGEIDVNYQIIKSAYEYRIRNCSFAENLSKY